MRQAYDYWQDQPGISPIYWATASPKAREVVLSPRAATDFLRVSKLSSENRAPLRQHLAKLRNICYLATLGPPDNTRLSAIRSLQKNVQYLNENLYCTDSEALQDTTHISSLTDRTLSSALMLRQQAPVNAVFVVEKIFCSVQDSAENRENTVF